MRRSVKNVGAGEHRLSREPVASLGGPPESKGALCQETARGAASCAAKATNLQILEDCHRNTGSREGSWREPSAVRGIMSLFIKIDRIECDGISQVTKYGVWDGSRHLPAASWKESKNCDASTEGWLVIDETGAALRIEMGGGFTACIVGEGMTLCPACAKRHLEQETGFKLHSPRFPRQATKQRK